MWIEVEKKSWTPIEEGFCRRSRAEKGVVCLRRKGTIKNEASSSSCSNTLLNRRRRRRRRRRHRRSSLSVAVVVVEVMFFCDDGVESI
uniref:F5/8 type C domain-containing protein n=1 Tax=Syphacia muris TaxID=451379 RepID=A0A0N5AFT1_9BILA